MASKKSKKSGNTPKHSKREKTTVIEAATSHEAQLDPSDLDLDRELSRLVRDMTLVGSKAGNLKTGEDDDDNSNTIEAGTIPYLPRSVLYYGWFFGESVSSSLKKFADDYLRKCASGVDNFQNFVSGTCEGQEIMDYFRKPSNSPKGEVKYHITAKFCGRVADEAYENKAAEHIGKPFDINIIGIVITKSTVGYRVALNEDQMELFDDERKKEKRRNANSSPDSPDLTPRASSLRPMTPERLNYKCQKSSKKQRKMSADSQYESPDYPGLIFTEQSISLEPTSTRAHITLGCAPKVKAFRTGEDLLDIIDLEHQAASKSSDVFCTSFDIHDIVPTHGKSILRQFGRQHGDAFVIYFSHRIVAQAAFMAYA